MGFLDKVMFWKKDDDFGLDFDKSIDEQMKQTDNQFKEENLGLDQKPSGLEEKSPFEQPATETSPFPAVETPEQPAAFQAQQQMQAPAGTEQRDLELLSSKLDTIKALLNSMDQRLANVEKAVGTVKKEEKLW